MVGSGMPATLHWNVTSWPSTADWSDGLTIHSGGTGSRRQFIDNIDDIDNR
jgi:hypothetical protein